MYLLNLLKEKKQKNVALLAQKSGKTENKINFANYFVKFKLTSSNFNITVTTCAGKTILKETAGNKKAFSGSQKTKKLAVNFLLKKLKFKLRKLRQFIFCLEVLGHSRNKKKLFKSITNNLKVSKIQTNSLTPFNGCKYRKIKRKKRKRRLVLL